MTLSKQETFDRAVRLAARLDDDFIELGRLLKRLQERDHELFKQVCEETHLDRRKAYYLIQIARQVEGLPIPRERLARIGWTRMQLVADQLTRENWPQRCWSSPNNTQHMASRPFSRASAPTSVASCSTFGPRTISGSRTPS